MDTKELLAKVRKIEIRTRRIVDDLTGGAYHSAFKGRGIEFDEVREYMPGDDVRTIDWNVTARTGQTFIKKFVEERELTVFLLVDISGSGDFGSGKQRKQEVFAEIASLLAFSAIRNNDQVGLLLFSDEDELYLAPRKGRSHVLRVVREMLVHERKHRATDIKHALECFMRAMKRKAVVFLISDFIDEGYEKPLLSVSKAHDLVAIRVRDPLETGLPGGGWLDLEDAETGEIVTFSAWSKGSLQAFERAAGAAFDADAAICRKAGVSMIDLVTGDDVVRPLMQFFNNRGKGGR